MYLEIITPDKKVFEGEVVSATLPGSKGSFQVLQNHAALISSLEKGTLKYHTVKGAMEMIVTGGVVEVLDNHIIVLAQGVEE
ncbi:MAG TPA: ATP synthase F1 subunit epsilon [Cytophagales bacterium]|jgi:F-type H+-transporting ATPase subunit epsilon|nr:ATP synthase F1 subunit epsilon [Cytophagales bacterium]